MSLLNLSLVNTAFTNEFSDVFLLVDVDDGAAAAVPCVDEAFLLLFCFCCCCSCRCCSSFLVKLVFLPAVEMYTKCC